MKHVWCIDDDKFNLFEGYVMDNYKIYDDNYIWEKCEKVHNKIEELKKYDETLFEKLLKL